MLFEKIKTDWLSARKSRNTEQALCLGTLVGALQTKEKTFNPARSLTDAEIIAEVKKFLANLQETKKLLEGNPARAEEYKKANTEIMYLGNYVPAQMSEAEIETFVQVQILANVTKMGDIMTALKRDHDGNYDGKMASSVVKRLLSTS